MTSKTLQGYKVEYWISWPIDDVNMDAMSYGEFKASFYNATDLANRAVRGNSLENVNNQQSDFPSRKFTLPKRIAYMVYHCDGPTNQTEVALSTMAAASIAEREACFDIFELLANEGIAAINVHF